MPNMTLAIPKELKQRMSHFKEINWSEVARVAIWEKTRILEKMKELLSKSSLGTLEIERNSVQIRKRVFKKHHKED